MKKRNIKPPRTPTLEQPALKSEWTEHPVVIAAGSVAATALIMLTLFKEVVIPTQTAKLEIDVMKERDASSQLRKLLEEKEEDIDKLKDSEGKKDEKIANLLVENEKLHKALYATSVGSMFSPGNPYPTGLGLMRIGMKKSELLKYYSPDILNASEFDPHILIAAIKDSPFDELSYYIDVESETISHISFSLPYTGEFDETFLQNKLVEAFGAPTSNPDKGFYRWSTFGSLELLKVDDHTIVVVRRGMRIRIWPNE